MTSCEKHLSMSKSSIGLLNSPRVSPQGLSPPGGGKEKKTLGTMLLFS